MGLLLKSCEWCRWSSVNSMKRTWSNVKMSRKLAIGACSQARWKSLNILICWSWQIRVVTQPGMPQHCSLTFRFSSDVGWWYPQQNQFIVWICVALIMRHCTFLWVILSEPIIDEFIVAYLHNCCWCSGLLISLYIFLVSIFACWVIKLRCIGT